MKTNITKIVIVGGTHGNEFTGAFLVKKFERFPELIQRSSFQCTTLLANPKAFAAGKRYIDTDLNRCFLTQSLDNATPSSYEELQAQAIYQMLGPKDHPQVDFILDLHTTTANMGLTIIPTSNDLFNLRLAAHLSAINPLVKAYTWPTCGQESSFLRSVCPLGCAIELGPVSPGVLNTRMLQETEALVMAILDYIDAFNQNKPLVSLPTLTVYRGFEMVDYPRDRQGDLYASIHPKLQSRDYKALSPNASIFLTFDQQTIPYAGQSTVYPVFINEAAYYEKGIAMILSEKEQILIPEI
jgi:aspartoacylase